MTTDDVTEGEGGEYLGTIRRNGEHLLAVINDILDVAKIEAGKMTIELRPVQVRALLADLVGLMKNRAAVKQLELVTECSSDVPEVVMTDPTRLKQALVNLVGNAIKFTEEGRIRVVVDQETDPQTNRSRLVFQVSDSGIGMDPATCGRLFEAFQQGNSATTRKYGGTGLGLVITRSIAELLGGEVRVTSEEGKGSTFTIVIDSVEVVESSKTRELDQAPLVRTGHTTKDAPRIDLAGIRVLYAEDGRDNQVLVQRILEKAGAEVDLAANGAIAVEKCQAISYDIVLMDQQMPELDGLAATRILRERGFGGPIVALSANAMEDDCQQSLQAGCVAHLNKPLNRRQLLETIVQYACHT